MTLPRHRNRLLARGILGALAVLGLGLVPAGLDSTEAQLAEASAASLDSLFAHYEAIRVTLVDDTTDGVPDDARELAAVARALAERAGELPSTNAPAGSPAELLPDVADAADAVATAEGLGAVREAYYELSKLLVRLRGALVETTDDLPEVVYCPMIKKSWRQPPDTPIGNPYAGAVMPGCGELVS